MRAVFLSVFFCIAAMGFGNFAIGQTTQSQSQPSAKNVTPQTAPSAHDFAEALNRQFEISPDGEKLVFLAGSGFDTKVVLLNIGTQNAITIPIQGELSVAKRVQWINDNIIMLTVSYATGGRRSNRWKWQFDRIMTFSLSDSKIIDLNPRSLSYGSRSNSNGVWDLKLENLALSDTNEVILSGSAESGRELFLTDIRTGRGRELGEGGLNTVYWVFDATGKARLRYDNDIVRGNASILVKNGNRWRTLVDLNNSLESQLQLLGILDEEHAVVLMREGNKRVIMRMSLSNGELFHMDYDDTRSVDSINFDPFTNSLISIRYEGYTKQISWLDAELGRVHALLQSTFPDKIIYLNNWNKNRTKYVIGVESGSSQYQEYLFDIATMQTELLTELPQALEQFDFPTKELLKFNARDGLEIPVFVTKPTSAGTRRLPTIIMPHGGPEFQDHVGFDFVAQFLATRGYLVIQPQFRGSTGNGPAFANAGRGEWGGKMQNDVSDSLKWAVDQGWADSSRICIVGASYGGYAALAGATMTPELYACAISFAGVSDLDMMLYEEGFTSGRISAEVNYWSNHIGEPNLGTSRLRSISPVHLAANVRAPILLVHGKDDAVVLIEQSRVMASALRAAGKNYELIELDGEDHNLSRQETRERFLVEMERFLAPILRPEQ